MDNLLNRIAHTPNSGRMHLFLGHPLSDGGDKTVVEPGNTTSPGIWTCGISLWWEGKGVVATPDTMPPEDLQWVFGDESGLPPEVTSQYTVFGRGITHRLANLGAEGAEGVDFHIVNATAGPAMMSYIAVKSEGPAGKKIHSIRWDEQGGVLIVGAGIQLIPETKPSAVCIETINGEPVAALGYTLQPDQPFELRFKVLHRYDDHPLGIELPLSRHARLTVAQGFEQAGQEWADALPARIFAPYSNLVKTWERCCAHILNAMELGNPRVGAVHYPLFWIRDGVLILHALDLMGRHDLARIGCDALVPMIYGGGFGAEADAPGEGIWALYRHALITGDTLWLETIYPMIARRVGIILDMLSTDRIMRGLSESRAPLYVDSPTNNIICMPSVNGTINGRMDHHHPNYYINMWAWRGLCDGAAAARLLVREDEAARWQVAANRLAENIHTHLYPVFGENERDSVVSPHPCGVPVCMKGFAEKFRQDFNKRRLPDGNRLPERLWTYFEAAQIHNALLCGITEEAWVCLDGMLADGPYDATIYVEGFAGDPDHNLKFGNGPQRRGWLNSERAIAGNMPHNWTNAEVVALIRDIFVVECNDDSLELCKGVPEQWLQNGAEFGVKNMPTAYGPVSYTARCSDGRITIADYTGPSNYHMSK